MSLVPYGDSDASDSESDEETPSVSSSSVARKNGGLSLPAPSRPTTVALPPSMSSSSSSSSSKKKKTKNRSSRDSDASDDDAAPAKSSGASSLFASLPKPKNSDSSKKKKGKKRKKKHKEKKDKKKKKKKETESSDDGAVSIGVSNGRIGVSRSSAPSVASQSKPEPEKPKAIPDPTSLITMLPAPKVGPDIAEKLKPKIQVGPERPQLTREERRKAQELRFQKKLEQNFNRKVAPRSQMLGSFAIRSESDDEREEAARLEAEAAERAEEERKRLAAMGPTVRYSEVQAQDSVLSSLKPDDPQFAQELAKNPQMVEVNASDLTSGSWTRSDRFRTMDARQQGENAVRAKFWDSRTGDTAQTSAPSKLHNRKHQINSLAYQAQERALEFKETRAQGFRTRQQSAAKYGWFR